MTNTEHQLSIARSQRFSVPFFTCALPDHESLGASLSETAKTLETNSTREPRQWSTKFGDLFESPFDLFSRVDLPGVEALKERINSVVIEVICATNAGYFENGLRPEHLVVNYSGWLHVQRNGSRHSAHLHPNSAWSGIYFVRSGNTDDASGRVRFYNPTQPQFLDGVSTRCFADSAWTEHDVTPEDGLLIVFPSFLSHEVFPYVGSGERISVAFNCTAALRD